MKKGYVLIVVLMGLIIAMPVYAVPIGYYPGLQELIDRADAIVVLRIDRHLTDFQSPTFYSTHGCYIYQTIKGNIPKNTRINLQLMNTETSFATPYAHGSTHLMFLMKKVTEDEPTEYRTLTFKGAQILLSPLGHEKAPEGKTIEQKIKKLIKDSIAYQAKEYEKKQKFLKAMFGQQEAAEPISKPDVQVEGEETKGEDLSFSPVKEVIVYSIADSKSAIDFDTGTLYTGGNSETREEFNNWLRTTGIDAVCMISSAIHGLCGFEMVLVPADNEKWDISPKQAVQFLSFGKPGTPANISGKGELPATYIFETREGGAGVLQVIGFVENPNGVKIRYKMVEPLSAAGPDVQAGKKEETSEERRLKQRLESMQNLRDMGKALLLYASDHQEGYPDRLQELRVYDLPDQQMQWLIDHVEYLAKGKKAYDRPTEVLAYDRTLLEKGQGTNVLFNDSHVAFEKPDRLARLRIAVAGEQGALKLRVVAKPRQQEQDEDFVLRVLGPDGKALEGAELFTHHNTRDGESPKAQFTSDASGLVRVFWGDIFRHESQDKGVMLYGLHGDKLAGFVEVAREDVVDEVELRLTPACRIRGTLKNSVLEGLGQELEWTNVYVYFDQHRPMSCSGKGGHFEFLLPAGEYKLYAYGTRSYGQEKQIEVKQGQKELKVYFDLPADRLALLIGKQAPEFREIKGWINARSLRLADLRGKVVLLDFWGYWCGPCVRSIPELMDLHEEYHDKGLVIIGVHDDSLDSVEKLQEKLDELTEERWDGRRIPFAICLDGGGTTEIEGTDKSARGATTAAYGIQAWPTMVLIDKEGKVVGEFGYHRDLGLLKELLSGGTLGEELFEQAHAVVPSESESKRADEQAIMQLIWILGLNTTMKKERTVENIVLEKHQCKHF